MNWAEEVKKYRIMRGWSQETMAYHTRISTREVSRLETGKVIKPHRIVQEKLIKMGLGKNGLVEQPLEKPLYEAID